MKKFIKIFLIIIGIIILSIIIDISRFESSPNTFPSIIISIELFDTFALIIELKKCSFSYFLHRFVGIFSEMSLGASHVLHAQALVSIRKSVD